MYSSEPRETTACSRLHAISHIFADDPEMLDFCFTPDRYGLNEAREKTVRRADTMDGIDFEKAILVRVAMDLWADTKYTRLSTLYSLSNHRLDSVVRALMFLNTTGGCGCPRCRRRPSPSTEPRATTSSND